MIRPVHHGGFRRLAIAPVGLVLAMAATAATVGCQAATPSGVPGSGAPVSTGAGDGQTAPPGDPGANPCLGGDIAGVSEARATITKTNLGEELSISAIEDIRFTDAAVAAASQELKAGSSGDALWAATWIYASAGCDVELLVPLLANERATIKLMAASAILAAGRPEGTPVLIALLADASPLEGARPPTPIADFVAGTFSAYVTGPTFADDAESKAIIAGWSEWLATHAAAMTFDATTGRWRAP